MSHAVQYLIIKLSSLLPNSTFIFNNEISLTTLGVILFFRIANTFLVTSSITEIKRPAFGGKSSSSPPVGILHTNSEVATLLGGNCVGFVCKAILIILYYI
jgi:hypothetical protein